MDCMNEKITARNKSTGKVGQYPRRFVDHPYFGKDLEEVRPGSKDLISLDTLVREMFSDDTPEYQPEEEEI